MGALRQDKVLRSASPRRYVDLGCPTLPLIRPLPPSAEWRSRPLYVGSGWGCSSPCQLAAHRSSACMYLYHRWASARACSARVRSSSSVRGRPSARSTSLRNADRKIALSSIRASALAAPYSCSAFLHAELSAFAPVLELSVSGEGGGSRSYKFRCSELWASVLLSIHVLARA